MLVRSLGLFTATTLLLSAARGLSSSSSAAEIIINVQRQHLAVMRGKERTAEFPVSTSKFGVGDQRGSYRTPLGIFRISQKIGAHSRSGAVFKGLHFTGEVLAPNVAGRDPIVTRVLCLAGGNAGARGIFIHGTPEEKRIGQPASYGCIRMRSRDVIALFDSVEIGTRVTILNAPLPSPTVGATSASAEVDWFR